jgi:hypothetical protein
LLHTMSFVRNVDREAEDDQKKEAELFAFRLDQDKAKKRAMGDIERELKVAEVRVLADATLEQKKKEWWLAKTMEMQWEELKVRPREVRERAMHRGLAGLEADL